MDDALPGAEVSSLTRAVRRAAYLELRAARRAVSLPARRALALRLPARTQAPTGHALDPPALRTGPGGCMVDTTDAQEHPCTCTCSV